MHKKHNEMQLAHGKIAVTESVAKKLKKQKMINGGGEYAKELADQNRFAKAILSK